MRGNVSRPTERWEDDFEGQWYDSPHIFVGEISDALVVHPIMPQWDIPTLIPDKHSPALHGTMCILQWTIPWSRPWDIP